MSAAELIALAKRVEAATGPDRDLDADIARAMGWRFAAEGHPIGDTWYNAERRAFPLPRYTASLDAAMTLPPSGKMTVVATGLASLSDASVDRIHAGLGRTSALALCAAALRAKASSHD